MPPLYINVGGPRKSWLLHLIHNSGRLALIFGVAAAYLAQIRDLHWSLAVASWIASPLCGLLGIFFALTHDHPCPACKPPRPGADLTKLHYRAVFLWARVAPVLIGAYFFSDVVRTQLTKTHEQAKAVAERTRDHIDWDSFTFTLALTLLAFLWITARAFHARYAYTLHHEAGPRTEALNQKIKNLGHKTHWPAILTHTLFVTSIVFLPRYGVWGLLSTATTALLIAADYADHKHSSSLCEACVQDFRVDAPQYADKRKLTFALFHRYVPAANAIFFGILLWAVFGESHLSKIALLSAFPLTVFTPLITRFHRRYSPWCPYCHGDDGGGDEHVCTPDPVDQPGKPIPV